MTELLIALAVMILSVFLVLAIIISGEHISDSIDEYRFEYEGRKSGGNKRIGMNYKQFKRLVESVGIHDERPCAPRYNLSFVMSEPKQKRVIECKLVTTDANRRSTSVEYFPVARKYQYKCGKYIKRYYQELLSGSVDNKISEIILDRFKE